MLQLQNLTFILLCYALFPILSSSEYITASIADTLSNRITQSTQENKWHKALETEYRTGQQNSTLITTLLVGELLDSTRTSLTNDLFDPRRDALTELVDFAIESATNYSWTKPISNETVHWIDATVASHFWETSNTSDMSLKFGKPVNFSFSSVHVPTEIYKGEEKILRGVDWSNELDKQFSKHQDMLWQYFGSSDGFVRNYPGSKWKTYESDEVDLYDSRRRPWYIQGYGTPKDVIILIDTSGSTVGQTLYLMQLTVSKLLDTLGENDYIQVANFSDQIRMDERLTHLKSAKLAPPCFHNFVQATSFNKRHIMHYVDALDKPRGQANFEVGLKYAYDEFKKLTEFRESDDNKYKYVGSGCSKIIIILTDGGIEKPEKLIFDNDPDKKVRIFTFAMGLSPTPIAAVRWLACEHKGWFGMITNIGMINEAVQNYSKRMSAVMASTDQSAQSLLSSIYKDDWDLVHALPHMSTNTNDTGSDSERWNYPDSQLGLGMLASLTRPVYVGSLDSKKHLGVMAIDIANTEVESFLPFRELGPLGYAFLVNDNGFIVRHPMLSKQENWNDKPPSIDFMDVEPTITKGAEEGIQQVREALVKGESDIQQVEAGLILNNKDDPAYFLKMQKIFYVHKLLRTDYSIGAAVPNGLNKVLNISSLPNPTEESMNVFSELTSPSDGNSIQSTVQIADWRYCNDMYLLGNESTALYTFIELVTNASKEWDSDVKTSKRCYPDLLKHLIFDADHVKAADLSNIFDGLLEDGIQGMTITTSGGLTVLYSNETFENPFTVKNSFDDPATKRAAWKPNELLFSAHYTNEAVKLNEAEPTIDVFKAITTDAEEHVLAVAGVSMKFDEIQNHLAGVVDAEGKSLCSNTSETICYLLDEGGFIISETKSLDHTISHIGQWVGDVDSSLMYALYNETNDKSFYDRHAYLNYQATCIYDWKLVAASDDITTQEATFGTVSDMLEMPRSPELKFLTTRFLTQDKYELPYGSKNVTCTKLSYQYFYKDQEYSRHSVDLDVGECARRVSGAKLKRTNLLLVVADKSSSQCGSLPPMKQKPLKVELKDYMVIDSSACQRHLRLRNPPSKCLSEDKAGVNYECRGGSLALHWLLGALSIIVTYLINHEQYNQYY